MTVLFPSSSPRPELGSRFLFHAFLLVFLLWSAGESSLAGAASMPGNSTLRRNTASTGSNSGAEKSAAGVVDPSVPPDIARDFEILRQQLFRTPRDVAVLNSLGILYARAGQLNDALSVWQRALEIDLRYVHLYNNIGSALKTQKRFAEARQVFQRGLQVAPSYWIYYNLGLLEKELGHLSDAAVSFQHALRYNPTFEPAQQKLREIAFQASGQSPASSFFQAPPELPFPFEVASPHGNDRLAVVESEEGGDEAPAIPRWGGGNRNHHDVGPITSVADCVAILNRHKPGRFGKTVALTFDDGPHPAFTAQLLDYLRSQGTKATFFVLGSRAEAYPHLITRMCGEGHELGNHTWSHLSLANRSTAAAVADLRKTGDLLNGLAGRAVRLVRPPYGHTNARVAKMIHDKGWHQIMWDADSRDWSGGSSQVMLQRVLRQFAPGGIVLFHDIHPGMLKVLPVLIPALKQCGYRFVTVSELMALDPAG